MPWSADGRDLRGPRCLAAELLADFSAPRPLRYMLNDAGEPVRCRVPKGTHWIEFTVNPAEGKTSGSLRITSMEHTEPSDTVGQLYVTDKRPHVHDLDEDSLNLLNAYSPDGASVYIEFWNMG